MASADRQAQEGVPGPGSGAHPATLLKAISHPVRARALATFSQRIASPSEVAAEQDQAVRDIAYHVRVLRKLGMIELVRTRQVRGATEHFYRGTAQPFLEDEAWRKLLADCA